MEFQSEHRFHGSPEAVARLLSDPDFHLALELPDLSRPVVLEDLHHAPRSVLRLRYEYVGTLDPIGRRLLGNRALTWIQEVDIDHSTCSGRLVFKAEAAPERLHGSAQFVIQPDGEGALRRLAGRLVVAVPVIGSLAEHRIVPGLLRRLDIEAGYLDARLRA